MLGHGLLVGAGGLAGAAALAACGSTSTTGQSSSSAEDSSRQDVARAERALIAQYAAVIASFPELSADLTVVQAQHQDHLAAMDVEPAEPAPPAAPAGKAAALAWLADAERQAAKDRRASCVAAADPQLARLLVLIASSEASHVPVLNDLGAR